MPAPFLQRSTLLVLSAVALTFLGVSFISRSSDLPLHLREFSQAVLSKGTHHPNTNAMTSSWTSPLSGFLDRADPYRRSHTDFKPPRSALLLAVLRNAPVEPEGFTLAVFSADSEGDNSKKHYAVDQLGRVKVLQEGDVETLKGLLKSVQELPVTEAFRNTWVVKQERTSQAIDRVLVPKSVLPEDPKRSYEEEYLETSVQGFDYEKRALKRPVDGLEELPQSLWEVTGALLESRGGEGEEQGDVLAYVRSVLGNVF